MSGEEPTRRIVSDAGDSALTTPWSIEEPVSRPIPGRIDRYRVDEQIGKGGFGIVFSAFDERLQRRVAIKVPHPNFVAMPEAAAAYLREARTVASLEHPHIVPVYDFGTTAEFPCFIVMKFIEGVDLRRWMTKRPPDCLEAARLIATVAMALHHAHKHGCVHRDLKPGNILIDADEDPHLVDFGLALREQDIGTGPQYAGTATYMSPEQARGEGHRVDGRSDIYSLGAVLYELLTGRRAVVASSQANVMEEIRFCEVKPLRQIDDRIPRELERICLKAMSKRVSERYTTAVDMADDLKHFLAIAGAPWNASQAVSTIAEVQVDSPTAAADVTSPTPHRLSSSSGHLPVVPKGLRSFEPHDADFFLGLLPGPRDRHGVPESIRFWKRRLQESDGAQTFPVGVIYGPSGCGKSSLVKAGLLPQLSSEVSTVFVEATASNTESELLKVLRRRWCETNDRRSLSELLASLRRGDGPSAGQKILIVLDQFEQWLHGTSDYERSALVEALRQCDGGRLQCLILVRDDFWLPISRFMLSLEIPLIEGENCALVDLFDQAHAKRVLAAFGRAYDQLPESKKMSADQQAFLDRAVNMLSENGKVISVRLALFTEMMKDRPWNSAALDVIGGVTGLGMSFLEQTFASPSAPPKHRLHHDAACKVLQSLLPEVGIDIKGEMKSRAELLEVSGYENRSGDFEQLIHLLDNELRLIAPTDPTNLIASGDSGAGSNGVSGSATRQKFYQLTHDYLVHSLREWLTRNQKTTRRGRAELRLGELVAVWKDRKERRLLPTWWEWFCIRLFTDGTHWTADQRQMMRQKDRYLATRWLTAVAALVVAGVPAWEWNGRRRAAVLTNALIHAPTTEVSTIVSDMSHHRRWIDPDLRHQLASAEARNSQSRQLRLRLGLLPVDDGHVDWLVDALLDAMPEEVDVIGNGLASYTAQVEPRLWRVLQTDPAASRRLRAACFVASVSPDDERWKDVGEAVLVSLISENAFLVQQWATLLKPAGPRLLPPLVRLISTSGSSSELRSLADLYAAFASDRSQASQLLADGLETPAQTDAVLDLADCRQQANLATVLAITGRWDKVWPLLKHSGDLTRRSYLIQRLGAADTIPAVTEALAKRLPIEKDASVRQAAVLVLGELSDDRWALQEREKWRPLLREMAAVESDPGVQSAIEWTLRRWGHDRPMNAADASEGMVVCAPAVLKIPDPESGQVRELVVQHPFAIGRTEVTITSFLRFREEQFWDHRAAPTEDCPVHEVSWYDAAAYCNWLSEQAGLPESQWCYAANEQGEYAAGMTIKANALELPGFRLPTTDEWEFACRAGTTTEWSMGNDVSLLDRYGWSMSNSGIHSHPVGQLRPNLWGLFDMHGGVWEWCHDRVDADGAALLQAGEARVDDDSLFAMRGGTYVTDPGFLSSSAANWNPANKRTNADGFRIARTVVVGPNLKDGR